jgi:hypothetical protein
MDGDEGLYDQRFCYWSSNAFLQESVAHIGLKYKMLLFKRESAVCQYPWFSLSNVPTINTRYNTTFSRTTTVLPINPATVGDVLRLKKY